MSQTPNVDELPTLKRTEIRMKYQCVNDAQLGDSWQKAQQAAGSPTCFDAK